MFRHTKLAIIAGTLAATGVAAFAAKTMENDTANLAAAKVSISQAIATAEQHASGKATRAELESSKAGVAFDIEVTSGSKVIDVKVDATNGSVISSAEDVADHENEEDGQD